MATTYNYTNQQTQSAYYGTASNFGNYQFITLDDICKQFMVAWCGDDKVLAAIPGTVGLRYRSKSAFFSFSFFYSPSSATVKRLFAFLIGDLLTLRVSC